MYELEGCLSSRDARESRYRHMSLAVCVSKINAPPREYKSSVVRSPALAVNRTVVLDLRPYLANQETSAI